MGRSLMNNAGCVLNGFGAPATSLFSGFLPRPRLFALRREAFGQPGKVHDHSLMGALADLFGFVMSGYRENNPPPVDLDNLGLRRHVLSNRSCRKMLNIDHRSDRAFTRLQTAADGIQRRVLHRQNHDRRRQHRRQHRILELTSQMLRHHIEHKPAFCPNRYSTHSHVTF